jgi:hypothetical protein
MPSPQEAEQMLELADDLVAEAKAVRRRCNVVVQLGARLREQLLHHLETEEVTRDDEHRNQG